MQEIHNTLIYAILQTISEFQSKLLLYSNGYYSIESDMYAEISEDTLNDALSRYAGLHGSFNAESDALNSALWNIRDIVGINPPDRYTVQDRRRLCRRMKRLDEIVRRRVRTRWQTNKWKYLGWQVLSFG